MNISNKTEDQLYFENKEEASEEEKVEEDEKPPKG
jgi:hypothetical protein